MSRMNPFAKKPTTQELLRESKRGLVHSARSIEKEIGSLQSEEKKLIAEIKRTAKTGNQASAKTLARQLIRLRQQIANLQKSRAQMRGIATHNQAMYANTSVASAMKGATKATASINQIMSPEKAKKVLVEFQKQSGQLDMKSEMMSDTIDDVLDDEDIEEETDELTNQVLDEIGIDISSKLASAPKQRISKANKQEEESICSSELDIDALLASLKT